MYRCRKNVSSDISELNQNRLKTRESQPGRNPPGLRPVVRLAFDRRIISVSSNTRALPEGLWLQSVPSSASCRTLHIEMPRICAASRVPIIFRLFDSAMTMLQCYRKRKKSQLAHLPLPLRPPPPHQHDRLHWSDGEGIVEVAGRELQGRSRASWERFCGVIASRGWRRPSRSAAAVLGVFSGPWRPFGSRC